MSIVDTQRSGLTTKLCRDCKWCRVTLADRLLSPFRPHEFAVCVNPKMYERDEAEAVVDGIGRDPDYNYCANVRDDEDEGGCGLDGKGWEPRA